MHHLQHEWEKLLEMFGIEQAKAETTFTVLVHMYSSPGRVYHTLEHIQAMLTWIESLRNDVTDLPTLQLACWFHDSIYDFLLETMKSKVPPTHNVSCPISLFLLQPSLLFLR